MLIFQEKAFRASGRKVLLGALLMCVCASGAQTPADRAGDLETVRREFNRTSDERAERIVRVRERERELERIWRDPRYTDAGMDELREQLDVLERQAAAIRSELKRRVEALPEVKIRREALEADRKALKEATRRRDELAEDLKRLSQDD